jgi:hypothetical protein
MKSYSMNYSISQDCHLIDIIIILAVSNNLIVISRLRGQNIGLLTTDHLRPELIECFNLQIELFCLLDIFHEMNLFSSNLRTLVVSYLKL